MSGVRLLVGTKKGAFVMTSDGKREKWEVNGPHFGGWEIYHVKGSPVDPNRIYTSQSTGWFGQVIQRSDDGGDFESGSHRAIAEAPQQLAQDREGQQCIQPVDQHVCATVKPGVAVAQPMRQGQTRVGQRAGIGVAEGRLPQALDAQLFDLNQWIQLDPQHVIEDERAVERRRVAPGD